MKYGCPQGHTDGIVEAYEIVIYLPVNLETGETHRDTLDGRETDCWKSLTYYCPTCQETSIIWSK
jgi:hypothetical protein